MRTVDVTDRLQEYLDGLVPKRDAILARIEDEAHREDVPIVDPHEGQLLYLLVRIAGAKRILELGAATGYSGIWLLRGTEGGTLMTYEMDKERAKRARANFADAGFGERAMVLEENAVLGLEKLDARFDACFIDLLNSFKSEDVTRQAVDRCIEKLDPGALLMADNALRQGEVLQPKSQQAKNVVFYNDYVARHPRLESVVIPIRDGLSVARVRD
jgi:caffeoyl-CoA O-methyltransferase